MQFIIFYIYFNITKYYMISHYIIALPVPEVQFLQDGQMMVGQTERCRH